MVEALEEGDGVAHVGLGLGGVLAQHVQRPQVAPAHGLEHLGEVPAVGRRDRTPPGGVEAGPDVRIEDVGEAGKAVGNGPHVTTALDVVLAPQRVEAGAVATHVSAQQRQVDERQDVVDGVVVFRDAQRPAQLGPVRPGVGMGQFPDLFGRDPGLRLGPGQGPLLHAGDELLEAGGGPFDEAAVDQPGGDDLPGHGVGQGDVGAHMQGQVHVGETGRRSHPGVGHEQLRPPALGLDDVMEEDRVGFPGVGTPEDDHVGVLDLLVGTGTATRPEHCRQTDDAGSVSGAVTGVDVVRADGHPHELLGHEVDLVGRLRAREHARRIGAARLDGPAETGRRRIEGLIPRGRSQPAAFPDERLRQPFTKRGIHRMPSCSSRCEPCSSWCKPGRVRKIGVQRSRRPDGVVHQPYVGEGTHTSGDGRDGLGPLGHRVGVDVAHEACLAGGRVGDGVDPHVDGDDAVLDHVPGYEVGHTGGHDEDVRLPGEVRQHPGVGGVLVAGHDGRIATQGEPQSELPDVVRAAHDDDRLPVEERGWVAPDVLAVPVEQVEASRGRGRDEMWKALGEETGIDGVDRLDVLGGIEDAVQLHLGDVGRQGPHDEDAGDPRVGVQLAHRGQGVGDISVGRHPLAHEPATHGLSQPPETALVNGGGVVVAHEHGGQARDGAGLPGVGHLLGDPGRQPVRDLAPVDHGGGHDSPTISPFSSMSIRSAAGWEPRPGMVRISPQMG